MDKSVKFWEVKTGKELKILIEHTDIIMSADVSSDDKYIASESFGKTIKICELF